MEGKEDTAAAAAAPAIAIATSAPAEVTVTHVRACGVTVYKALAGATATLAEYNARCVAAHGGEANQQPLGQREWGALYTQFKRDHVLGTVPYRWNDPDTREARLVAATFEVLDVVVIDGPLMHSGAVSGAEKAAAVKRLLGIDAASALMPTLGERGQAALVRETADEWELVLPHALLASSSLGYSERGVARFRRHRAMPVTHEWMVEGDAAGWCAWDDGHGRGVEAALAGCAPDLGLPWLPSSPPSSAPPPSPPPALGGTLLPFTQIMFIVYDGRTEELRSLLDSTPDGGRTGNFLIVCASHQKYRYPGASLLTLAVSRGWVDITRLLLGSTGGAEAAATAATTPEDTRRSPFGGWTPLALAEHLVGLVPPDSQAHAAMASIHALLVDAASDGGIDEGIAGGLAGGLAGGVPSDGAAAVAAVAAAAGSSSVLAGAARRQHGVERAAKTLLLLHPDDAESAAAATQFPSARAMLRAESAPIAGYSLPLDLRCASAALVRGGGGGGARGVGGKGGGGGGGGGGAWMSAKETMAALRVATSSLADSVIPGADLRLRRQVRQQCLRCTLSKRVE